MGDVLAATRLQLRSPARDPLGTPGLRSALGTGGRALSANTSVTTYDEHPVEHNPLASMPHDTHGGISNPVLGMLLFITSEIMFFGGLFAAYFSIRANAAQWPPINNETGEPFAIAILPLVGPATILLILSSVTCQYAVWAIRRDDRVM